MFKIIENGQAISSMISMKSLNGTSELKHMRSYIKTEWQSNNEIKIQRVMKIYWLVILRTIFQRSKVLVHSWPDKRFIHNYWTSK